MGGWKNRKEERRENLNTCCCCCCLQLLLTTTLFVCALQEDPATTVFEAIRDHALRSGEETVPWSKIVSLLARRNVTRDDIIAVRVLLRPLLPPLLLLPPPPPLLFPFS